MEKPLWRPSIEQIEKTALTRFSKKIKDIYGIHDTEYSTLHKWSIENPDLFWAEVWKDCEIFSSKAWKKVINISDFDLNFIGQLFYADVNGNFKSIMNGIYLQLRYSF